MGRVMLKEDTLKKLSDYLRDGCITHDQHYQILKEINPKQMIKAFVFLKPFDNSIESKIWMYLINHVWKGVDTDDNKRTVFSENESIFFKTLLKFNGQMTRCFTISKLFSTCYINDLTAKTLEEMGIIDIFKLPNYEVIYSLNLHFYKEAIQ